MSSSISAVKLPSLATALPAPFPHPNSVELAAQGLKSTSTEIAKKETGGVVAPTAENIQKAKNVGRVFASAQNDFKGTVLKRDILKFAKDLKRLIPEERRWLVNKMATAKVDNTSLLNKVLSEATSSGMGVYEGLSEQDQKAFLKDLIPGQSGKNIKRIFFALENNQAGSQAANPQKVYSRLLAWSNSPNRLDAVGEMVHNVNTDKSKTAAAFIAEQIGSMSDVDSKLALNKLNRATFDAVVRESIARPAADDPAFNAKMNGPDFSRYTRLADTVARSGSLRLKSAFIASSGVQLKDRGLGEARVREILKGMTKVIQTDTNGVIANTLALTGTSQKKDKTGQPIGNYASSGMQAIGTYNKALIDTNQGGVIRVVLAQLQTGNDFGQNAYARIDGNIKAAEVLGSYTGTVATAIDAQITDNNRNNVLSTIFGATGTDLLKEISGIFSFGGPYAKVGAVGVKALFALNALRLASGNIGDGRTAVQNLVNVAKPQGVDGVSLGVSANSVFNSALQAAREASR